jgi:S1-C subfamily serine protease
VQLRPLARTNLEPAEIFKKVAPSVYAVLAGASRERMLSGDGASQGSAIAVSRQELITNCHVVDGMAFIVIIQKDRVHEAKLVKSDPTSDRCVIRVESGDLSPIQGIRSFSDLSVGERAYSVGTPSGLEQTLGEGLISGLRKDKGIKLIQTSAPISPGSSGGGLFDASGNLIGITTFMLRDTQSLNFAIAAQEFWRF